MTDDGAHEIASALTEIASTVGTLSENVERISDRMPDLGDSP